ncbi:MAG: hypothetical protein AAF297_07665 [Planctomycetota bacterium]
MAVLGGCATGSHSAAEADNAYQPAPEQALPVDTFALLREATDHEALYTLVGGLKPMSTGIWRGSFAADTPDLAELRGVRAALAPLRNDIWYADVQVFSKVHDGERAIHAFVVHRDALARMIDRYEGFWSPWGITPCTHPTEMVAVVDRMPKADRWRGYGYLFGYPAQAVDFFVEAGLAANDGREVGPGKDRQFIQIPTYAAKTGRFTYVAPLHHAPTAEDKALAAEARGILEAFTERRPQMRSVRSMTAELRRLNRRFSQASSTNARTPEARPSHGQARERATHAVLDAR